MLSICVPHKDRSFYRNERGELVPLFRRAFDSIVSSVQQTRIEAELVIADWPGDPALGLGLWAITPSFDNPRVRRVTNDVAFSRGGARNLAASWAMYPNLLFIDADMIIVPAVIARGLQVVKAGKAFFPIDKLLRKPGDPRDPVETSGFGNSLVSARHYEQTHGFQSRGTWGGEDVEFARWFQERGLMVREPVDGFLHVWHPHPTDGKPLNGPGALDA